MSWEEGYRNIRAAASQATPLHDFLLVQEIQGRQLIIRPGTHKTGDHRWRSDRPRGTRHGRVLAVGRGDRKVVVWCEPCGSTGERMMDGVKWRCHKCGARMQFLCEGFAAPKYVNKGDVVIYVRVPANDIVMDEQEYTLLHHEQHALCVTEKDGMNVLIPLYDRVVLRRCEAVKETKSGLAIPDQAVDKPQEAIVVAVGIGRRLDDGTCIPPQVKIGDHVIMGKFAGTDIEILGEKLVVVSEGDLLGYIREEPAKLAAA